MGKLENLSLIDRLAIGGKRYAISSKIKLSDIDNKKEILRYGLKDYENSVKWIDIDLTTQKYQLLTSFRPDSFFSEEKLGAESSNKIECRFMILDCFGTGRYDVADYVVLREYREGEKLIVSEENKGSREYYSGTYGNLLEINVQKEQKYIEIQNKIVVEEVVRENPFTSKLPLILIVCIGLIVLLISIAF